MTALIAFGSDRLKDDYVNSSWWFEFLERHVEPEAGDLRRILDENVSVIGVNFSTMTTEERAIVADWLVDAIGADIGASRVTGQSLDHLTALRAKVAAVTSGDDQGS
jgi:hypothetical protein